MDGPVRIPDGFVDELKKRLRPSEVIGRKVKLKRQGKEWVGLSPFTNERTPSFYVNDAKGIFKDFSSGLGGDVISFVMETERLSFMEAVERLAEVAGMPLPRAAPADRAAYDRKQRLREACEAAAAWYEQALRAPGGAEARRYLASRGFSEETIKRFRLGYAPEGWRNLWEALGRKGFSRAELAGADLVVDKDPLKDPYDRFRNRIIFPITDRRGGVIAFGGRTLEPDGKPKYLNSSETELFDKSSVVYNARGAREAFGPDSGGGFIVCEGYMDVIALANAGIGHAVAPLGTALTERQLAEVWRAGPEPIVCFDGDRAGLQAAARALDTALPALSAERRLRFALLPDGQDPDDLIRAHGTERMQAVLDGAVPASQFLWQRELKAAPAQTPEQLADLEMRLKSAANRVSDPVLARLLRKDIEGRVSDLRYKLIQEKRAKERTRRSEIESSPTGDVAKSEQNEHAKQVMPSRRQRPLYLAALVDHPFLLDTLLERLEPGALGAGPIDEALAALLDLAADEKAIDRKALASHLASHGNTSAASLVLSLPETGPFTQGSAQARHWLTAFDELDAADEAVRAASRPVSDYRGMSFEDVVRRKAEQGAARARLEQAADAADPDA